MVIDILGFLGLVCSDLVTLSFCSIAGGFRVDNIIFCVFLRVDSPGMETLMRSDYRFATLYPNNTAQYLPFTTRIVISCLMSGGWRWIHTESSSVYCTCIFHNVTHLFSGASLLVPWYLLEKYYSAFISPSVVATCASPILPLLACKITTCFTSLSCRLQILLISKAKWIADASLESFHCFPKWILHYWNLLFWKQTLSDVQFHCVSNLFQPFWAYLLFEIIRNVGIVQ